jgi:hypothetical protein
MEEEEPELYHRATGVGEDSKPCSVNRRIFHFCSYHRHLFDCDENGFLLQFSRQKESMIL